MKFQRGEKFIFLTLLGSSDNSLVHNFRYYLTQFPIDTCPDSKGDVSSTLWLLLKDLLWRHQSHLKENAFIN